MPNWDQSISNINERNRQLTGGTNKAFQMSVSTVSTESEEAKVSFYGNTDRQIFLSHPFVSVGSWIRAMPENGATMVGTFRVDEASPQPVASIQKQAKNRIQSYKNGLDLYRPLMPGEMEVSSSGRSQAFFARRPKQFQRAGLLARNIDQDRLAISDKAPIHTREFLQKTYDMMGDEERFGITYRNKNTWDIFFPKIKDNYCAEYYANLTNPSNTSPKTLFQLHRGHVTDSKGIVINQIATGLPLRVQDKYYANDDTFTVKEIDEKGNVFIRTAEAAIEGYQLDVSTGHYRRNIAKNDLMTVLGSREDIVTKNSSYLVGDNLNYTVNKTIKIKSELAESSLVFDSTENNHKAYLTTKDHSFTLDNTVDKEAIYLIHKKGSIFNIDPDGSIKTMTFGGNLIFLDEKSGAVTVLAKNGAMATFKKEITLSDGSGKQILTFDGTDTIQILAGKNVTVAAQKVSISSGTVDIGNNASLSSVLGEPLCQLFDSHTHATIFGPSGPPLPPFTATMVNLSPATAILSKYVKIRSNIA